MADELDSELEDSQRVGHEDDASSSELRFECSDGGNHPVRASDNVPNGEDLNRNEFSVKLDSRVFSGLGSNAAKYKMMSPARLPISRSPCLTIPPGLSPTSLLDSPVLLSNMKVEPSPTTGSFSKPHMMHGLFGSATSSTTETSSSDNYGERSSADFEFKPHFSSGLIPGSCSLGPPASAGSNFQKCEPFVQFQDQFQVHSFPSSPSVKNEKMEASPDAPNPLLDMSTSRESVPPLVDSDELRQEQGPETGVHSLQSDHKGTNPSIMAEKSSEDGYNWRKYGQKHVKGSEFPRSYYKCTHPNCQVKKQLERSHDGQITEIIYKGSHDHPKPQTSRRLSAGTILSIQEERADKFSSFTSTEVKLSNTHGHTYHLPEQNGTLELVFPAASDEDVEGAVAQSDRIVTDVDDDEDSESKRRRIELGVVDVIPVVKPIREARVIVQTLSEVDILDDGYRWRKYGQKVVKGNPNPRSYYKCTNAGCPVRKHVERASHDPKAVITTYEGKHNHDVPTARNTGQDTAGPSIYATSSDSPLSTISDGTYAVSLDLGVGINSSADNRLDEKQQMPETDLVQAQSRDVDSCCVKMIQETPVSAYHGVLNNGIDRYGSKEVRGGSFSFETPPLNRSTTYPQDTGRLLMP